MIKAALLAATIVLIPLTVASQEPPAGKDAGASVPGRNTAQGNQADDRSRFALRDNFAEVIDRVMDACDDDIEEFCEGVTSGGGRIAMCMLANEDQLSGECRSSLQRASRQIRRSVDRIAEGCLNEIQNVCGSTGKIGRCIEQKKSALSASCQAIVGTLARKVAGLMAQTGLPVYSSDNKVLGHVIAIAKAPDGSIQSIQVDIGRSLGIGTKLVTITADKLNPSPGLNARLSEAEVRALPEAKKQ
jgi:hypothetical protein